MRQMGKIFMGEQQQKLGGVIEHLAVGASTLTNKIRIERN
jgi:hypothetical protein